MDLQDQEDPITESGVQLSNEELIISVLESFDSSELSTHHAVELMGVIPWGFIPPTHPEMSLVVDRVDSFDTWPPALKQRPYQMAEAGFYYSSK